jgi:hypothetical protein
VSCDQWGRELVEVAGGMADALDAGEIDHVFEHGGEVGHLGRHARGVANHFDAVGVHVLPKDRHLFHSLIGATCLMDKSHASMAAKAGNVDMDRAEKDIKRKEGIIQSMTPLERRKPELIKATRKRRIAACAGVQEVNGMLKEFEQMQDMRRSRFDL